MTRTLKGLAVPRDTSDGTNYPFDRIKNDTTETSKDGTPLYEATLGDVHQAGLELIRLAGLTPNDLPDKKGSSQIADAIGFLNPVMIIKAGWSGSAVAVLGGSYLAGYTAEYTTSLTLTGAVANKLTIKKDGSTSTENYFVDITIVSSTVLKNGVTVGASHSTVYFDNDDSNIYISANAGGTSDADLQKVGVIIKVFKA